MRSHNNIHSTIHCISLFRNITEMLQKLHTFLSNVESIINLLAIWKLFTGETHLSVRIDLLKKLIKVVFLLSSKDPKNMSKTSIQGTYQPSPATWTRATPLKWNWYALFWKARLIVDILGWVLFPADASKAAYLDPACTCYSFQLTAYPFSSAPCPVVCTHDSQTSGWWCWGYGQKTLAHSLVKGSLPCGYPVWTSGHKV